MTTTQIEVFVCVAKMKNFTRAGEILGMTQSAVSHAIFNLERDLEVKLFERTRSGVILTDIGEAVYVRMRTILYEMNMIYNDVKPEKNVPEGILRVGMLPSTAATLMPKVMRLFAQEFPQVEVVLFEGTDDEVEDWIENSVVDIGFVTLPNDSFNTVFMIQDELCVLLPEKHLLANAKYIALKNIQEDRFIMSKGGCEPLIRETMASEGLSLCVQHEVNSLYTIAEMVKEGVGITLMPSLALGNIAKGGLIVRPLKPPVYRQLALAYKHGNDVSRLLTLFIQKMKLVTMTYESHFRGF
jgi:DNA-binding transcriptional LysR family regulator